MIWHLGSILPDDALAIPVADRTFEHGLGLFETLRTWDGRATLLRRHRERILRSAAELGLDIDPESLPDHQAVARLFEAEEVGSDRAVRITASGGVGGRPSTVWMRSLALPATRPDATVWVGGWDVLPSDPMARHKALNYWSRRIAFERARAEGCDEALSESGGRLWEGSRTNLFIVRDREILTPSHRGPIVPGLMRGLVLEVAARSEIPVHEAWGIDLDEFRSAEEAFLTNAVRVVLPVASARSRDERPVTWATPGPITALVRERVEHRLRGGVEL